MNEAQRNECPSEVKRSDVDRFVMRVTTQKGMVNIGSPEMFYGNIRNMYNTGSGCGLQLEEQLEHKRGELIDICSEIAEKIYELQDILNA